MSDESACHGTCWMKFYTYDPATIKVQAYFILQQRPAPPTPPQLTEKEQKDAVDAFLRRWTDEHSPTIWGCEDGCTCMVTITEPPAAEKSWTMTVNARTTKGGFTYRVRATAQVTSRTYTGECEADEISEFSERGVTLEPRKEGRSKR